MIRGLGSFTRAKWRMNWKLGVPDDTLTEFSGFIADYAPGERYVFHAVVGESVTGSSLRVRGAADSKAVP